MYCPECMVKSSCFSAINWIAFRAESGTGALRCNSKFSVSELAFIVTRFKATKLTKVASWQLLKISRRSRTASRLSNLLPRKPPSLGV